MYRVSDNGQSYVSYKPDSQFPAFTMLTAAAAGQKVNIYIVVALTAFEIADEIVALMPLPTTPQLTVTNFSATAS